MADLDTRLDAMIARLREEGYRLTPQRLAVLRILADSQKHPSVEGIYERVRGDFPMTSLATIYKTVTLLKEMGQVMELSFGGMGCRYDGRNPHPHPHLMCLQCRNIVDADVGDVTGLCKEVSRKTGYRVVSHRLDFFGICRECQEKE